MSIPADRRRYAHWWLDRCFLYVGRMTEAKGVPEILHAWMNLVEELGLDCPPLWLVGGEPHEIEAMRRSADLSALARYEAAGRVKWWGYLNAAGISTLMLKTYVLVTHSLYEPGGRVVLEAMAQGIPVIATPHGFAADLIADWHSGFLVAYGDRDALKQRMAHFALQPLLRHALGRVAQQVAFTALSRWDFMEAHVRIYTCAISHTAGATVKAAEPANILAGSGPIPRGFSGVYPFEGEVMDRDGAAAFLVQHVGQADAPLIDLPATSGRSCLWLADCNGRRLIVKHAFTTYERRPMWDRGYCGSAVSLRRLRVWGEMLAASFNGVAPLIAADPDLGLTLREWLEPATVNESTLPACAQLLAAFHKSQHHSISLDSMRARLDRNWDEMSDEGVLAELAAFEADWRIEGYPWHAWQPMSIRLSWRWLKLGLNRRWLSIPAGLDYEVGTWISEGSAIAAVEESAVSFGFCHGDSDPAHLRLDGGGNMVLIDCERLHPGYFGHDWAGLVARLLNEATSDAAAASILKRALKIGESHLCPTWLLLSWLRLITIMRLCRAHALMETEAIEYGLRRLKRIQRLTG